MKKTKKIFVFFFRILTKTTKVTAWGSRWRKGISCPRQIRLKRSQSWRRRSHMSISYLATTMSQRFHSSQSCICHLKSKTFQDFLRKFSRYNFAQYCLGLLFTNRLFKVLAQAQNERHVGPCVGTVLEGQPSTGRCWRYLPTTSQVGVDG